VQTSKQAFTQLIVYELKTAEKLEKKQPIFFKIYFAKNHCIALKNH